MADGFSPHFTRRSMTLGAGALFAWAQAPRVASAAKARDPRLLVVILRGGLDGLSAVAPIADPAYVGLREHIALQRQGDHPALPLDGFFFMHPAMPQAARMFKEKSLAIVHAVATPYRDRSHFDAQDVLESGVPRANSVRTGWLNRLLEHMPHGRPLATPVGGLAIGASTPLILRGEAPVLAWFPPELPAAPDGLIERMLDLYVHTDPELASVLDRAMDTDRIARDSAFEAGNFSNASRTIAASAARFLKRPDGPRVAALSLEGFDTHANTGGATGRLAKRLEALDTALHTFETELAPVWHDTTIVVATEFGRAAQLNGTSGTDHGNGTVAFLAGGAVAGGRVLADWPGLRPTQLLDGRDLMPTTDLRAVLKGVALDHLDVSAASLSSTVFPGTEQIAPMRGLIA